MREKEEILRGYGEGSKIHVIRKQKWELFRGRKEISHKEG